MAKSHSKVILILASLLILLIGSCSFIPLFTPLAMDALASTFSSLNFDMSGAKAIAATGSSTSRGISKASGDGALVKIMEDGSTQSLVDFGANTGWQPNVAFISMGDDGSAYICFQNQYYLSSMGSSARIQFVRVYPDNHYDVLWPLDPASTTISDETVATWSWWGMDSDPLAKGPDGMLYFKVLKQGNSSDEKIYKYDPVTAALPTRVTPESAGLFISTFMVDSKSRLYIQSSQSYSGTSSFLRYYKPNVVAPTNIYYSSTSNMWVRGYIPSQDGDYMILNGNNIRGMNGIIKVSNLDSTELKYELTYANANASGGNYISLVRYSGWTDDYETSLIKQVSTNTWPQTYAWVDAVKNANTYDKTKMLSRIARYFLRDSTTLDFKSGAVAKIQQSSGTYLDVTAEQLLASTLSDDDPMSSVGMIKFTHTSWDGTNSVVSELTTASLGQYIEQNSEDFLRNTFNKRLFKDWLQEPGQATLRNINFDYVGAMTWGSNGLYALYSQSWWGGGSTTEGAKVVKLLDLNGNTDLKLIALNSSGAPSTNIKILGDYIYYRYDILDGSNLATGFHRLARKNFVTGAVDQELTKNLSGLPTDLEILTYDVSDDNRILYFVAYNQAENKVLGGRIDMDANTWSQLDTAKKLNSIKIVK